MHLAAKLLQGSALTLTAALATPLNGQSSSLYLTPTAVEAPTYRTPFGAEPGFGQRTANVSPVQAASLIAVPLPEPRTFAVHDLITIIIRESTQSDMSASLETEKSVEFDHQITAVPDISLRDFLAPGFARGNGLAQSLALDLESDQSFEGDGTLSRGETITGRIQARVIDVKPNGTLSIEARKYNQIDRETVTLTLTGIIRADDVTAANTVLSSQIYDLHLTKEHSGELRRATRKGLITQVVELLFNF
ncbi:MAG: flagellar basal body L-ring protein FlgH [Planctomycetota bacterium]